VVSQIEDYWNYLQLWSYGKSSGENNLNSELYKLHEREITAVFNKALTNGEMPKEFQNVLQERRKIGWKTRPLNTCYNLYSKVLN
jgi:hypothetical protein